MEKAKGRGGCVCTPPLGGKPMPEETCPACHGPAKVSKLVSEDDGHSFYIVIDCQGCGSYRLGKFPHELMTIGSLGIPDPERFAALLKEKREHGLPPLWVHA